jgi:hypothetical protein
MEFEKNVSSMPKCRANITKSAAPNMVQKIMIKAFHFSNNFPSLVNNIRPIGDTLAFSIKMCVLLILSLIIRYVEKCLLCEMHCKKNFFQCFSVSDPSGLSADPDRAFYLDADPVPDPDPWSQTNADPDLDPVRLCHHKKLDFDMKLCFM